MTKLKLTTRSTNAFWKPLFLSFLVGPFAAAATAPNPAPAAAEPLHLVYPDKSDLKAPVNVEFSIDGNHLRAHFEVESAKINAKPALGPGEYPYQHDVVEVFVAPTGKTFPYFEFELSPFDQSFEVQIVSLDQPFQEGLQLGMAHSVQRTPKGWTADLEIPLNTLGWDGDASHVIGNAYAILGEKPNRSYWSRSLPQEKKPNFHKPEFFKPLIAAPKPNPTR